jgi:hypothetical protein
MKFRWPQRFWEWLLLLTPALVIFVFGDLIPKIKRPWGGLAGAKATEAFIGSTIAWGSLGLLVAAFLSVGLGMWLTPEIQPIWRRRTAIITSGMSIFCLNLAIAFAGCAALG